MNDREIKKQELIRDGTFQNFKTLIKQQWNEDQIPNQDPKYYGVDEDVMRLLESILKSTKRTKAAFRKHISFMNEYYDNIGLLTLGYSDLTRDKSSLESKRHIMTKVLKECFDDFIGKFEISPTGKLHAHLIVAWNGNVNTFPSWRTDDSGNSRINTLVKKDDLQELWYGQKDENGQPTKYGIYDLVLVDKEKHGMNKTSNYVLKSLNTMESYITKDEQVNDKNLASDELILEVNHSNIIVARNTPFQSWNKARTEQDKYIKKSARIFEPSFYDEHKYSPKSVFREWAEENRFTNISMNQEKHIDLFGKDFKLIDINDYRKEKA